MKRIRVIPVLLIKGDGLYKSRQFKNYRYVGDPINAVRIFNNKEVDELAILDISATKEGRAPNIKKISEIASFWPSLVRIPPAPTFQPSWLSSLAAALGLGARTLASEISEPAQEQFDAKSERWQDSDAGTQIRTWIGQWELSLDDVDLDLPEPLEGIDSDEHANILEGAPGKPEELEYAH